MQALITGIAGFAGSHLADFLLRHTECAVAGTIHRQDTRVSHLRDHVALYRVDLRRPIYRATAAYGHFGRTDIDAPWEHTDKAESLRHEAGLD